MWNSNRISLPLTKVNCTSMSKPHLQYKLNLTMCTTPKSAAGLQNQDLAPLFIVRPTLL